MQIIWFECNFPVPGGISSRSVELEKNGFTATMYPYGIFINDYFTRIARNIDKSSKFKYIVAIRPYVISPQYLHMICSSLNQISHGRVAINFLTGWIYDNEKFFGGILSEVNDNSTNIDRSNYMIEYAKEFKKISKNEFYISTTNETIFDLSKANSFPMIIPYSYYKTNKFNTINQKYIVSVAPIISDELKGIPDNQDAAAFTKNDFFKFLDDCNENNVEGILLQESIPDSEYSTISQCIKEYKVQKSEAEK